MLSYSLQVCYTSFGIISRWACILGSLGTIKTRRTYGEASPLPYGRGEPNRNGRGV